ncbi:hypothetical protein C8R46DRAFT_25225 [Mycena filopes]|nr:hypothetical protein C8R46DRAFT_25225 [Mycena filopes]
MASMLSLSPELHLSIVSHLHPSDQHSLRLVSQQFNNLLALDVPLEDLSVAAQKKTMFLVEKAKESEIGYEPFIIRSVRKVSEGGNTTLSVDVYYPKYMRNDDEDEVEEPDEWEIAIEMDTLSLSAEKKLSSDSPRLQKSIGYDLLRGKLLVASAGLLRTRFDCPECGNGRNVCPGCGGFSRRFGDLFCSCGWPMPCPVCIGYGTAYDAKRIQDDEEVSNLLCALLLR